MTINKIIATVFGIGYIPKGGGTVAAIAFCVLFYFGVQYHCVSQTGLVLFTLATFLVGVYVSNKLEAGWGKDSKRIVIDEVHGMAVSLLFMPINLVIILAGLILFRIFDIWKPLYIRRTEKLKGGWGVMVDDLVAGIYSNIVLQIIIYAYTGGNASIL
jgi:phosphatidylglycerophosphatase A